MENYGIKIIYAPEITLVGEPRFLGMPQEIMEQWDTDIHWDKINNFDNINAEYILEAAGRGCYQSWANKAKRKNVEYLKNILKQKHESVLEHACYNFYFRGISRSLTHELIRHRVGTAFSQSSQRYIDSSDIAFVIPPLYIGNKELTSIWAKSCKDSLDKYNELLAQEINVMPGTDGIKQLRQSARAVLPNCAETQIMFSCNLREIRHILNLRGSLHADEEIRRWAVALYYIVNDITPLLCDFEVQENEFGKYLVKLDDWE
jgi:thymidylate synthase (FAD)